ncbi:hypothetical protein FNF28_05516 [Cafeteria roenbergensis]|uniref:VHS domain-containing protein n=1 Tax=Cafeteria roenbergensis TaxID=33653 RepID=A0A5A8D4R2_CAFRO|nr:hypothetical protein FNF28_05516 [Cafeteria roenbergensis]
MASLFRRRKKVDIGGLDELITTSTVGGEENVAANITICDRVNLLRTPEELMEVVEVMRARLGVRDEAVTIPSLFLLEMLIKNCGMRFAQVVAANKGIFTQLENALQWLQRRIRAKEPGSVRASHKALELIQSWGEEFLPMRTSHGLEAFVALYHKLRARGFKFTAPQLDETRPPIFTPPSGIDRSVALQA